MDIHEHGVCVDKENRRVKCNHCGKEMQSFNRLKYHLGGVRYYVRPCELVTDTVRETFRNMILKDKPGLTVAKRVGKVQTGNRHKRARSEEDSSSKSVSACNGNINVEVEKRQDSSTKSISAPEIRNVDVEADKRHDSSTKSGFAPEVRNIDVESSSKSVSAERKNTHVEADKQDFLSNKAQKCIGRFFYENSIDFSAMDSPSFKELLREMTVGVAGGQKQLKLPDSRELNRRMLQETLKEVQDHVKKTKDSWEVTGCSILLDAWVDHKGRDLVSFVADSPAGPVYLKSFDVSDVKNDVIALISLVDGLVQEVGVHNVIQIIACSTSGWVGELGKSFVGDNKRKVFWSVSISHCIELMLEKIGEMDSFGDILDKVSNILEFIKNNPSVLKLFRDHNHGIDMITTEYEFVTPYLTIESIFKAKNDLEAMFALSDWNKKGEGILISKLVKDSTFWETLERFVKSTTPLIRGLLSFLTSNNQNVGYIYDTVVGIKKSIAKQFNGEKVSYKPLWDVIDDVWKCHLHSALHVTGYLLNPAAFYSTEFKSDTEVITGVFSSFVRLVKDCSILAKLSAQLDMYTLGKDCFHEASQANEISKIPPAEWWAQKASQHQELQSFAIKILSQTCEGASRYKLKRSLAEKLLLTEGMSRCEQKHLEDLAFVHYNLHLQSFKAKFSEEIVVQDVYMD